MRRYPALLIALLAFPSGVSAQVKASEPAKVSQTIDGTVLTLEYSRPRVRGRDSLFGKVVTPEEVWTPGANWATTLEVSKDIQLDGHPVAKGKYSVWIAVHPRNPWVLVLDPRNHRFHTDHPDSTAEQIRYVVNREQGDFTEVLTWSFPEIRISGGTLLLQWGTVRIPFRIDVTPSYSLATSRDKAGPYLGRYTFAWTEKQPGDTVPMTFTITHQDSTLMGEWNPEPWPGAGRFVLIGIKDDWFIAGWLEKGELYEVDKDMVLEFAPRKRNQKQALSFEVRGTADSLWATGKRK
jgi:hypothetical protein